MFKLFVKCPKCGKKMFKMKTYNPTTKTYNGSYHYTHIYNLFDVLIKPRCHNVIMVINENE